MREADVEKVGEATSKASLTRWIGQEEPMTLTFRRLRDGQPAIYSLQTIKTRESDDYHIVMGLRRGM